MPKLEAQKARPQRKWEEGASYKCVLSKSPGYKVDWVYQAYKNQDGHMCLKGSDGFEDLCVMLVSGFEKVIPIMENENDQTLDIDAVGNPV